MTVDGLAMQSFEQILDWDLPIEKRVELISEFRERFRSANYLEDSVKRALESTVDRIEESHRLILRTDEVVERGAI